MVKVKSAGVTAEIAHPVDPRRGHVGDLAVHGDEVWGAGGENDTAHVLRSTDGGKTFKATRRAPATTGLRGCFLEKGAGWVVGEGGFVWRSRDDGATWESIQVPATACMYFIERDPAGVLWVTGDDNVVLRSRDGKTWAVQETDSVGRLFTRYRDPHKPGVTWLVDSDGIIQRGQHLRYKRVEARAMRVKRPLCRITRTPKGSLVVIGDGGLILRSTNEAKSWTKIPHVPLVDYERITCTPLGIFVIGDGGTLLVSYDDGRHFETVDTAMTGHLWALAPVDGALLVGGQRAAIWRLTNRELALHMARVHPLKLLRDLAARYADDEPGAQLVLEDALRERELW